MFLVVGYIVTFHHLFSYFMWALHLARLLSLFFFLQRLTVHFSAQHGAGRQHDQYTLVFLLFAASLLGHYGGYEQARGFDAYGLLLFFFSKS